MFKEGPLPAVIHGLAEYIVGALFIALPLVLGYDSGAATAASIIIGVVIVAVAASTDWGLSLNNQIPKPVHFAIDWILAGILIASPFLFGFSGEDTPTAIFVAAGVLHLLLTIGTRFGPKPDKPAKAEKRDRSKSSSSKIRSAADGGGLAAKPVDSERAPGGSAASAGGEKSSPGGDVQPGDRGTGDRRGSRRS